MVNKLASTLHKSWRLLVAALALSLLTVWTVEQITVARGFQIFQENLYRHAAHLADGKQKAVVLGSMIMMGGTNPIIRETARGSLKPDNPQVIDLMKHLHQSFDLGNIRIVNSTGQVVAYFTKSGKSATGEIRSSRPYFIASMKGSPSMYPALGHTSGARGFYVASPIFEKEAAINVSSLGFGSKSSSESSTEAAPAVIGAVVAKLGFEEVDYLLNQESDALAVVSPEGVVFASNVPAWQYKVLGNQQDIELVKKEQRVNEAFEKSPPQLLGVDDQGRIMKNGHSLKMAQTNIDWKDPNGPWKLVGFADPTNSFGNLQRIFVGAISFIFIMLFGGWIQARQRAQRKTEQVTSLLDNSGQGFLSFGADLIVDTEYSHACDSMFGQSPAGRKVTDVLFHGDPANVELFCSIVPSVVDIPDLDSRESMLSLLPTKIQLNDFFLKAEYKILENGKFMLVITDVTQEKYMNDMLKREHLHLELIVKAVSDSRNFFDTLDAFHEFINHGLARILNAEMPLPVMVKELYREIHTYKGLLNQFSFPNTPKTLHDIETNLSALQYQSDALTREQVSSLVSPEALQLSFNEDIAILTEALGEEFLTRGESIVLSSEQALQLEKLANRLLRGETVDTSITEIRTLLNEICMLRKVTFKDVLMGFDGLLKQVARRVGKEVVPIEVAGGADIWIDPHAYRSFLHALVHVFRNAIAHGIEAPEARWEVDKHEAGKISCRVTLEGSNINLTIADDGAGINLDALRQKAVAAGIYNASEVESIADEEIAGLIFKDNISTQQEVTELAGRGVGLAAVLQETESMGGKVVVKTVAGQGTEFRFTLPLQQDSNREGTNHA